MNRHDMMDEFEIDPRLMSAEAFAALGLEEMAYVRPVVEDGEAMFAVFSASGQRLALMGDRDTAMAAILQHDMIPVSVH